MLQGQDPDGSSINIAQGYEHRASILQRWRDSMSRRATGRDSNHATEFVERWRKMFPDEPYMAMEGHSAYVRPTVREGVRLAKTTDKEKVIKALESGIGVEAPSQNYGRVHPARERNSAQ